MDNTAMMFTTTIACPLEQVSDDELLQDTRRLVGQTNRVLAALLAHLSEVEARGLHRVRACSSLYTYCIYELRMSEDTAFRRVSASRLVRRFPALLIAIERGELHLTGLLLLGPHLTEQNVTEVLARAKHRTKKEVLGLVRQLSPMSDVPSRVEPLGPPPRPPVRWNPRWADFVGAICPVRELLPGERPSDWLASAPEASGASEAGAADVTIPAPARAELPERSADHPVSSPVQLSAPQRYAVQFTANEEYVALLEEAKSLLAHALPSRDLAEVHLRAMRTFVAELKKRKYAVSAGGAVSGPAPQAEETSLPSDAETTERSGAPKAAEHSASSTNSAPLSPSKRGRHLPAAVRRAVFQRDGGRCSYVDDRGERCRETARLEFHHHEPFALGGRHDAENVSLRCAPHNALAAEQDFGRALMTTKRRQCAHSTWRAVAIDRPDDQPR
jgi:hypothetical protein